MFLMAYFFQYIIKAEVRRSTSEVDEPVCGLDPRIKLAIVLLVVRVRFFQDVMGVLGLQPDVTTIDKFQSQQQQTQEALTAPWHWDHGSTRTS